MKVLIYSLLILTLIFTSCQDDDNSSNEQNSEYRQSMRAFVIGLSDYAKNIDNSFVVIPQNGQELITSNGEEEGALQNAYIDAIDGTGREDFLYGYDNDNEATPAVETEYMKGLCDLFLQNNLTVMVTDYCWIHSKMDISYQTNEDYGYISFAADERELNNIPDYPTTPFNVNSENITILPQAKNFLYLINSENFATKADFINAVSQTSYDLIIMDLFHDEEQYTSSEITQLKTKQNGGARLVICYMSIGEAEDYRYYWQSGWEVGNPSWLAAENPDWEGNYKVKYWDAGWQSIIYGNDDSYLKKILDAAFDGVYLDIIDAFEYFE